MLIESLNKKEKYQKRDWQVKNIWKLVNKKLDANRNLTFQGIRKGYNKKRLCIIKRKLKLIAHRHGK